MPRVNDPYEMSEKLGLSVISIEATKHNSG